MSDKSLEQTVVDDGRKAGAAIGEINIFDNEPNLCATHGAVDAQHRCEHFDKANKVARAQEQYLILKPGDTLNYKGLVLRLQIVEGATGQLLFNLVGFTGKKLKQGNLTQTELLDELRRRIVPGNEAQFMKLMTQVIQHMTIQDALLQQILHATTGVKLQQMTEHGAKCAHGNDAVMCPLCRAMQSVAEGAKL